MDGKALIDKARALGHSDRETARLVGVDPSYLRQVYKGHCRISEQTAVLLAELVGEDPDDVLRRVTVANEKNPARRSALERVLFTLGACSVALTLHVSVTNEAIAREVTLASVYTSYAMPRPPVQVASPWACPPQSIRHAPRGLPVRWPSRANLPSGPAAACNRRKASAALTARPANAELSAPNP